MTAWQKVRNIIESIGRDSTAHGVSHFFNANNTVKKSLWLICTLIAGFLFMTLASMNVSEYLDYQVTTKIRFLNENTSDFPAVAICNSNPFVTEYAIDYLIGLIQQKSTYSPKSQNLSKIEFINHHFKVNQGLKDHVRAFALAGSMNKTERQKLGFPLKKVIISCRFNTIDCIDTGFTWKYSWQYGNCYVFNSDNQFKLQSKGELVGLTIELFKGFDELVPIFESESGLKLIIYNHTNDFKNNFYMEKTGLKPGNSIKLSFKRNFIEKLKKPYSECDLDLNTATIDSLDSVLFRSFFKTRTASLYGQTECHYRLYHAMGFEKCNCVVFQDYAFVEGEQNLCNTTEELDCFSLVYNEVVVKNQFGRFAKDCPLECNMNELIFQASSDSYPSYYHGLELLKDCPIFQEKFFNRSLEIKDLVESTMKVSICSQRLGYQLITEVPTTTILGLLGNLGGMLGKDNLKKN